MSELETFNSFFEYKKRFFPKLCKREQEAKKFTKKSWEKDLWELFKKGFKNDAVR